MNTSAKNTEKKVILHTLRQASMGGGETFVRNLIRGLDPSAYKSIFVSFADGSMVEQLRNMGYVCYVIPFEAKRFLGLTKKLLHIIKTENVNIVHGHGTKAALLSWLAARWANKPLLYTVHSWSVHPGLSKLNYSLRILVEKFLVRTAKVTINGSESDRNFGIYTFGLYKNEIVKNAIEPTENPYQSQRSALRRIFGFKPTDFVVLFLGRNTYQKDPLTLIRAMELLKHLPHIKLLFVGSGDMDEQVKNEAVQLALGDQVIFRPGTTDTAYYRALADVFVLPSRWECLSLAVMEAMADGLPVIASDIDSTHELFNPGTEGITFRLGNPTDLASNIEFASKYPNQLRNMGVAAKERALRLFNTKRLVNEYDRLYTKTLQTL